LLPSVDSAAGLVLENYRSDSYTEHQNRLSFNQAFFSAPTLSKIEKEGIYYYPKAKNV